MLPPGNLVKNPGICSDWELNQQPFGPQTTFWSTDWATTARAHLFLITIFNTAMVSWLQIIDIACIIFLLNNTGLSSRTVGQAGPAQLASLCLAQFMEQNLLIPSFIPQVWENSSSRQGPKVTLPPLLLPKDFLLLSLASGLWTSVPWSCHLMNVIKVTNPLTPS